MPAITKPDGATILVTGSNGFIGTHIVGDLLARGYSVRAAVRNESRGQHLLDIYKKYGNKLTLAAVGDISDTNAFNDAVKGVDGIVHTASPVGQSAVYPEEQIKPAVGGVVGILNAALKYGSPNLQRVVLTSSCAAIRHFSTERFTLSELDWNDGPVKECEEKGKDAHPLSKYSASKTLAEKAAWTFYDENKSKINWDISIINPPWVFGPTVHEVKTIESLNSSNTHLFNALIKGEFRGNADHLTTPSHGWVDVRDVSEAHARALEVPEAGGERIIVSAGSPWVWQDLLDVANSLNPAPYTKRPLFKGTPGGEVKRTLTFDTSKEKRILGIKFRSMEDLVRDSLTEYAQRGW